MQAINFKEGRSGVESSKVQAIWKEKKAQGRSERGGEHGERKRDEGRTKV